MPMLNVFIAIIPLLLLSAAFVQVSIIQATLPANAVASTPAPGADETDLAIVIRTSAYVVTANDAVVVSIPRGAPADSATVRLQDALRTIAAAHPQLHEVRVVAEPTTRYDDIIGVMDAARAAGLPGAALADAASEGA